MLSLYLFYDNLGLLYSKRNACMHIMLSSIVGDVSLFCNLSHKGHPPGDKRLVGCFSDLMLELSTFFSASLASRAKVLCLEQLNNFAFARKWKASGKEAGMLDVIRACPCPLDSTKILFSWTI